MNQTLYLCSSNYLTPQGNEHESEKISWWLPLWRDQRNFILNFWSLLCTKVGRIDTHKDDESGLSTLHLFNVKNVESSLYIFTAGFSTYSQDNLLNFVYHHMLFPSIILENFQGKTSLILGFYIFAFLAHCTNLAVIYTIVLDVYEICKSCRNKIKRKNDPRSTPLLNNGFKCNN